MSNEGFRLKTDESSHRLSHRPEPGLRNVKALISAAVTVTVAELPFGTPRV
ncbi:hypothetical protein RBSH_03201 [Rhodopirellula baltica SH28]|uniref:Uncharacterized protein n=1 Tax=Rhodopirellula baltica SH28 TaxID=993517 RepID=K5CCZ9_RHOBT|nr:hypothetical protein RBSH_03201 [Rhodopirellula baltica SH28]